MRSGRILIVDEPESAQMLARMLTEAGYETTALASGSDLLAKIEEYTVGSLPAVDLVLLDIRMPGVDGLEACRRLRALPGWDSVPVLILTELQRLEDRSAAFAAGASDCVTKPLLQSELLARVGALASLRMARARQQEVEDRVRKLAVQVLNLQEEERKRIAQELHDEVGQILTGVKLNLTLLERALPKENTDLQGMISRTRSLIDATMAYVRQMASSLRPPALDELGLIPALQGHVDRLVESTGLEVQTSLDASRRRLPREIETAVYRIVSEATTNIVRHAAAHHVEIVLQFLGNEIYACVADDGRGFNPEQRLREALQEGHVGVRGMRERATNLQGRFKITSAPGHGTRLEVWLPC
jgi:signal transduction histidine kinase